MQMAFSLPVLLLPLAPASAGVGANGVYYGVYCGVFAVLWAITNWDRLEFLFQQPEDASGVGCSLEAWGSQRPRRRSLDRAKLKADDGKQKPHEGYDDKYDGQHRVRADQ